MYTKCFCFPILFSFLVYQQVVCHSRENLSCLPLPHPLCRRLPSSSVMWKLLLELLQVTSKWYDLTFSFKIPKPFIKLDVFTLVQGSNFRLDHRPAASSVDASKLKSSSILLFNWICVIFILNKSVNFEFDKTIPSIIPNTRPIQTNEINHI